MAAGIFLSIIRCEKPGGGAVFLQASYVFFLRFGVVTAVFFPLFACRMIGAGDIKLAGLICSFLGLRSGALAVGFGFLLGAFWSLIKMIVKGGFFKRLSRLLAYIRHTIHTGEFTDYFDAARDGYEGVIPLGLCLFIGTFINIIISL